MQRIAAKDIDEYIAAFSGEVQANLVKLRITIQKAAPKAEEKMSYAIPTFFLNGKNLVHFAGYEKHIGFYPTPSGIATFTKELKPYSTSKGAVQFPLDKPLPVALISEIVKYRVKEISLATIKKKKQS